MRSNVLAYTLYRDSNGGCSPVILRESKDPYSCEESRVAACHSNKVGIAGEIGIPRLLAPTPQQAQTRCLLGLRLRSSLGMTLQKTTGTPAPRCAGLDSLENSLVAFQAEQRFDGSPTEGVRQHLPPVAQHE